MKSLNSKFINSLNFTSSHLANSRKIGEFRAKQILFSRRSKEALEGLKQHSIIESVESSNRLDWKAMLYLKNPLNLRSQKEIHLSLEEIAIKILRNTINGLYWSMDRS